MATKKTSTRRKTTTKKTVTYKAGTGKIKTKAGVMKPKASTRRTVKSDRAVREVREKLAPLPESCHYTKAGAKRSADKLRANGVKARVVSSGRYQCVYTVGKCSKGAK